MFPTYPVILPFKGSNTELTDFYENQRSVPIPDVPKFDPRRVVDGQRSIEFLKPLPTSSVESGKHFEIKSKVIGVYDKGKASVVETQQELVERETGEVYTRLVGSAFFVGQGGWGGPKGPAAKNYPPPEGKEPDVVVKQVVSPEAALLYRLNGDYNPLHADPAPGKKMGFGGVIMHGLYSWNASCHLLLKELAGSDPSRIKEFQARFVSPVKPGDTLVLEAWKTGKKVGEGRWEEVLFVTKTGGGKVALSNGRAVLKLSARSLVNKL